VTRESPQEPKEKQQEGLIAYLLQMVLWLMQTVANLQEQLVQARAQQGQNSANSSRPPSTDPPGAPARPRRRRSGRKRGGQPGHPAQQRALLPPERISQVVSLKPTGCRRCGGALQGEDAAPVRHQVIELPQVQATGVEYQVHSLLCGRCQIRTSAHLPPGVPRSGFGPRLQALVGVCSGAYRMSKRTVQQLLLDLYQVPISVGSICKLQRQTSEALAAPVAQVAQAVRQAPCAHADETSWRERGRKVWMWVVTLPQLAYFAIRPHRSRAVIKELLGAAWKGILTTDRYCVYSYLPIGQRQLCWAHLLRDFLGMQQWAEATKEVGAALYRQGKRMFRLWHRVRDGTMSRAEFAQKVQPVQQRVHQLLLQGALLPIKKVARTCRQLLKVEPAMWTFVQVHGLEPTNNEAERTVRPGVLMRKVSLGTQSAAGSRFVERMLTVTQSLRLQGRNVLHYVTLTCQSSLSGAAPPSLLPSVSTLPFPALAA